VEAEMGRASITITLAVTAALGCGSEGGGQGFSCPDGENPDGNGCLLPCEDGWHPAPDGACVVDCPSPASEGTDGMCDVSECPEGWALTEREFLDGPRAFCELECPEGMEPSYMDGAFDGCVHPCPDGWTSGTDGLCHLDCPEGMTPVAGPQLCEAAVAGEDAECPPGQWDDSFDGPNPVYVDQAVGSPAGDGTPLAPFATISQAVAAAGAVGPLTIHLAAGAYQEHVWLQDRPEVNLIGACAELVHIAPEALPSPGGYPGGAVQLTDVDNLVIRGVTIDSPGYGIRIEHAASAGQPERLQVEQVVVAQAEGRGIAVWAAYEEARVRRCTVRQALGGIGFVDITAPTTPFGDVVIEENLIEDLRPLGSNPYDFIYGAAVNGAHSATFARNTVRGFTEAAGIVAQAVSTAVVRENLITSLEGLAGVYLRIIADTPVPVDAAVEGNVFSDCAAGPNGVDTAGEKFSAVAFIQDGGELRCDRNLFSGIQGPGLWVQAAAPVGVAIDGCEFIDGAIGVLAYGGSLAIGGSRFHDLRAAVLARDEGFDDSEMGPVTVGGCTFARRADGGHDLPGGGTLDELLDMGYDVELSMIGAPLDLRANAFFGNLGSAEDTGQHHSVSVGRCGSLTLSGNAFSSNDGVDVFVLDTESEISGNRFSDGETALYLASDGTLEAMAASVEGNFFGAINALLSASLADDNLSLSVQDNSLVVAAVFCGYDLSSWELSSLIMRSNSALESFISWSSIRDAAFTDNLLRDSSLVIARSDEGSLTSIADNAMVRSGLHVSEASGAVEVAGNGVFFGLRRGTGIGVFGSPGPVTIRRNIVAAVETAELEGIGEVGDGIHVVGDPDGEASSVLITSNLLRGNDRLGIILHGSTGAVEGNMYVENGCGIQCDLVVQSPSGDGVAGWDTGFAAHPDTPFGVIPAQEALDW
jgi:hypothetical protein